MCSVQCRAKAAQDPALLQQATEKWQQNRDAAGGWQTQDKTKQGYCQGFQGSTALTSTGQVAKSIGGTDVAADAASIVNNSGLRKVF